MKKGADQLCSYCTDLSLFSHMQIAGFLMWCFMTKYDTKVKAQAIEHWFDVSKEVKCNAHYLSIALKYSGSSVAVNF